MYFKTSDSQKCFKHLVKEVNELKKLMQKHGYRHTALEEFLLLCLKSEIKKRFDNAQFVPVCLSDDKKLFQGYLKMLLNNGTIALLESIIDWANKVLVRIEEFEVQYLEKIRQRS